MAYRTVTAGKYATFTGSGRKFRLISDQDLVSIQEFLKEGTKQTWIADLYGVRQSTISKIKNGQYRYVQRQPKNE